MRNLHLWFAAGIGVFLATFALAVLRAALAESLWLDELHTSWTVSGSWQEIASRAAAGNQTPLYFWSIGIFTRTLGQQTEWVLRLPSVFAWFLALVLVALQIRSKVSPHDSRGWLFALCIASWVVLDRLQWFFASEARPYAFVQLVSLAGWCCIEGIVQSENRAEVKIPVITGRLTARTLIVAWCVLSVANIYLHLTAALPVLFQWLVGAGLAVRRHYRLRQSDRRTVSTLSYRRWPLDARVWTLATVGIGLTLLPLLQLASPVWQRRGQWATFASDVSIARSTSMFPFVPVLLCVLIGCLIDRVGRTKDDSSPVATEVRWLWWIAMLGPWLLAWSVTAMGVAPMFHQRFVFATALPLYMVGAIELLRCRRWATRWLTSLAVGVAIVFSQGSVSIWRAGYLIGNLRGEDWRAATQWVRDRIEPGESLLCSSGLIEANANVTNLITLPLDAELTEYLSFPLRGLYQITDQSGQAVSVTPLLGDHRQWATQVIERLAEEPTLADRFWLIYRGAPGRLKKKLTEFQADLQEKHISLEASDPKRFGSVYVVELSR